MIDRRRVLLGGAATLMLPSLRANAGIASSKIESLLKKHKVPAVAIAVVEHGEIAWTETWGMASTALKKVATPHHRFQAASLSKTFNAMLVLKMFDDGDLDIDEPVNNYLTSWQLEGPNAHEVTAVHLLSHTGATTVSGFPGYEPTEQRPTTTIEVLDGLGNTEAVVNTGRPGRKYAYSGGGVTVLQALVEDISGQSYSDLARARLLDPLGLQRAVFRDDTGTFDNYCCSHDSQGRKVDVWSHEYPELAAAGLWTTAADYATALIELGYSFNNDGGYLSRQTMQRMVEPVIKDAALGTFGSGDGGISHSGSNYGFRSLYQYNLEGGNGWVLLTNGDNGQKLIDALVPLIKEDRGW